MENFPAIPRRSTTSQKRSRNSFGMNSGISRPSEVTGGFLCTSIQWQRKTWISGQLSSTMIEIGVFHNGASDLPAVTTPDGVVVNKGTLDDVSASNQRVLVNQVRQGILADKLDFDYFFMTEHHFQPEGAEFSPNPLLTETPVVPGE